LDYSIKQVSERTDLKPHVLRYYEKEGLLPGVKRNSSGIRRYSEEDLEWLGLICCLKHTGMSIRKIRDFMDLCVQGDHTLKQRCDILQEHKREVEEEIREMNRHLEKVNCKISYFTKQYEKFLDRSETIA
jgi:DNA-binding transcriptional MerR regulator